MNAGSKPESLALLKLISLHFETGKRNATVGLLLDGCQGWRLLPVAVLSAAILEGECVTREHVHHNMSGIAPGAPGDQVRTVVEHSRISHA